MVAQNEAQNELIVIRNGELKKKPLDFFDLYAVQCPFINGMLRLIPGGFNLFIRTISNGKQGFTYEELAKNGNKKHLEQSLDTLLDSSLFSSQWCFDESLKVWQRKFFNKSEFAKYLYENIKLIYDEQIPRDKKIIALLELEKKLALL